MTVSTRPPPPWSGSTGSDSPSRPMMISCSSTWTSASTPVAWKSCRRPLCRGTSRQLHRDFTERHRLENLHHHQDARRYRHQDEAKGFEVYHQGAYSCVTGNHFADAPATIRTCMPGDVKRLLDFMFPPPVPVDWKPPKDFSIDDEDLACDALFAISPNYADGYHDWVKVGIGRARHEQQSTNAERLGSLVPVTGQVRPRRVCEEMEVIRYGLPRRHHRHADPHGQRERLVPAVERERATVSQRHRIDGKGTP